MDNKVWYYPFCFVEVFFFQDVILLRMNLPAASLINKVYLEKIASVVDLHNELQGELSVVIYYYVSDEKQKKVPEIDV